MISKAIKCALVIGATIIAAPYIPRCYRDLAFSGLNPAKGFPSWNRARRLEVEYAERNGNLETYLRDGRNRIPVQERNGSLLVGRPEDECQLYAPEEKKACDAAYKYGEGQSAISSERGTGQWLGEMLRKGVDIIDDVVEGVQEGYNSQNSQQAR